MPIQQKLPPPVLLFSDFAGWVITMKRKLRISWSVVVLDNLSLKTFLKIKKFFHLSLTPSNIMMSKLVRKD